MIKPRGMAKEARRDWRPRIDLLPSLYAVQMLRSMENPSGRAEASNRLAPTRATTEMTPQTQEKWALAYYSPLRRDTL